MDSFKFTIADKFLKQTQKYDKDIHTCKEGKINVFEQLCIN